MERQALLDFGCDERNERKEDVRWLPCTTIPGPDDNQTSFPVRCRKPMAIVMPANSRSNKSILDNEAYAVGEREPKQPNGPPGGSRGPLINLDPKVPFISHMPFSPRQTSGPDTLIPP